MSSVESGPLIDLVTGSVGRFTNLERLSTSIEQQSLREVRLIVVEQRDPSGAATLLRAKTPRLSWQVLESAPGLSRARNEGLRHAAGQIIGFPDDDCWYERRVLEQVARSFSEDPQLDILVGRQITQDGHDVIRAPNRVEDLNRDNVWRVAMSSAIFIRARLVRQIGEFDPELGVGATSSYQSGEETDFVLRGLALGGRGRYDPSITIRHPAASETKGRLAPRVGLGYGRGMGHVLRRHGYNPATVAWHVARPAAGAVIALIAGDLGLAKFRVAVAAGRILGYFSDGAR